MIPMRTVGIVLALVLLAVTAITAVVSTAPAVEREAADSAPGSSSLWTMKRWSPYVVGVGIGILSWLAFLLSDKPLGVSTAYARTSGMIEQAFRGESVREKEYYREYAPKIDWEWMLVAGLFAGALLSSCLSSDFRIEMVPPLWEETFGRHPTARWVVSLAGGMILGIGARWADGCTSGHGISGTLQLVVSSWVAVGCFFIGGVATALFIQALSS